ncbi:RHS repeat-associated core domain-containing protein [Psychrobacter sp. KFRI-CH2-11]|uniref:RHS repeat-associated core domain-containing protein n=1 Tax=Psychrobacter sp. KFRI-CH2-11 TaxID=3156079 RepID=UPI003245C746
MRHSERNKLHLEISREQGALSSRYHYDPMGRLTTQQSNRDQHLTIQRDYHYDALGQLTHLSGHSVINQGNKNTQPSLNNQTSFKRNHQYQYDAQGRLTEHKLTDYQNHTGITEVFAFDPASNRVPVKADAAIDSSTTDQGRPRELIQDGKRIRYTYDSHGRVLYKTTEAIKHPNTAPRSALQLQYNANNELEKSLRTQYQDNNIIKTLTEYHYDAFGRRITKHSETRNFIQSKDQLTQSRQTQHQHTHMLWDSDLPIQEYTDTHVYTTIYDQGSFVPIARLAWLRDDLPKVANDELELSQGWYGKDKPNVKTGIQGYHYHNDQLGTPNELTNEKGEVIWLADYEAWGNTAKLVWNEQVIGQIQVSQNELQPIRFQGQHFDEETGLHYNRFRYYDPDVGMFTTRDPIGLMGGGNVFQYALNPTGWVDPLGLVTREAAIKSLANDSTVQPKIPARARHGRNPSRPEEYSAQQINERWSDMYQKDIARHIRAGRMPSCPSSAPNVCTSCNIGSGGWKKYGGNPNAFHCGFDGYLENRVPNKRNRSKNLTQT